MGEPILPVSQNSHNEQALFLSLGRRPSVPFYCCCLTLNGKLFLALGPGLGLVGRGDPRILARFFAAFNS